MNTHTLLEVLVEIAGPLKELHEVRLTVEDTFHRGIATKLNKIININGLSNGLKLNSGTKS